MHSRFARVLALFVLFCFVPVAARADAMSDQKKAYDAMGMKITKGVKMCFLLTPSEAGRYLGKPVRAGEDAGIASGCAYHAADGSNDGILVTRDNRSAWSLPPKSYAKSYRTYSGVGEKAYTVYEAPLGYEATVLSAKGTTQVLISGKAPAASALALARIAMDR